MASALSAQPRRRYVLLSPTRASRGDGPVFVPPPATCFPFSGKIPSHRHSSTRAVTRGTESCSRRPPPWPFAPSSSTRRQCIGPSDGSRSSGSRSERNGCGGEPKGRRPPKSSLTFNAYKTRLFDSSDHFQTALDYSRPTSSTLWIQARRSTLQPLRALVRTAVPDHWPPPRRTPSRAKAWVVEGSRPGRSAVPPPEKPDARAGPAYGLRGSALPERRRVLGAWHRDLHDPRRRLHAELRLLRGRPRPAAQIRHH